MSKGQNHMNLINCHERVYICPKKFLYQLTVQILLDLEVYRMLKNDAVSGVPSVK